MIELGFWAQQAMAGSMLLAVPVAVLAGLVSFFSPCVVPLLPGYLSYAGGMNAADLVAGRYDQRRMLAGSLLFVAGFGAVFVAAGIVVGGVGAFLIAYQDWLMRVAGIVTIAMGVLVSGILPFGRGELRLRRLPQAGLLGAPLLGAVFGLSWTPCMGPTLSVVIALALTEGSASRGALLAFFYAIGLGLPFVIAGLIFSRMTQAVTWMRRHHRAITLVSATVMIIVGIMLVTGWWSDAVGLLRQWAAQFTTPL